MASPRAVAIVFSFLVLAAASPSPLVQARMVPADGEGALPAGTIAAPEITTGSVGTASSLQEALVQRPPLPLPQLMSPPTMAVFAQRSMIDLKWQSDGTIRSDATARPTKGSLHSKGTQFLKVPLGATKGRW
ncbi:hypothetical protein VPH35_058846 [Triticum aestivum]|uniref:Uncharacterized protein n=1 Tax=Aegilops tauschii TaxID=37682 RepID=M8ATV5_AEGTA